MENIDVFENWLPKKNVPSPLNRISSPNFNVPQTGEEQMLIKDFKNDVEKVLVQKYARPNFADNTYSSRPASLAELIKSLEQVIEDYKSKL